MAYGDAREGKWRGNWGMEWVARTLHTTSEHGVSSITTADARTSAASSRLNWRPRRFKWTRPFRRTKSGFCACAITFQTQSTKSWRRPCYHLVPARWIYRSAVDGRLKIYVWTSHSLPLCEHFLASPFPRYIGSWFLFAGAAWKAECLKHARQTDMALHKNFWWNQCRSTGHVTSLNG